MCKSPVNHVSRLEKKKKEKKNLLFAREDTMVCVPVSVVFDRGGGEERRGEERRERDDEESVTFKFEHGNTCHNLSLRPDSAWIEFFWLSQAQDSSFCIY